MNLIATLAQLIEANLNTQIPAEQIEARTSLFGKGLGLDSVDVVDLICLIEEHFGLELTDGELRLEHFKTVGTVADLIAAKLKSVGEHR